MKKRGNHEFCFTNRNKGYRTVIACLLQSRTRQYRELSDINHEKMKKKFTKSAISQKYSKEIRNIWYRKIFKNQYHSFNVPVPILYLHMLKVQRLR
jgi:hypothetical protein